VSIINLEPVEMLSDAEREREALRALAEIMEHYRVAMTHDGDGDIDIWFEVNDTSGEVH
jgi:hypothetical protein